MSSIYTCSEMDHTNSATLTKKETETFQPASPSNQCHFYTLSELESDSEVKRCNPKLPETVIVMCPSSNASRDHSSLKLTNNLRDAHVKIQHSPFAAHYIRPAAR